MSLFSGGKRGGESRERDTASSRADASGTTPTITSSGGAQAPPAKAGGNVANIGKSIVFKGDLTGDEDLQIDGSVEGGIQLANHELTIGDTGRAQAQLYAKSVIVIGNVTGDITATERVELQASATVEGDIHTPRLVIAEGAALNGSVEMTKAQPSTQQVSAAFSTAASDSDDA